jgi:glyoxylate reductase
MAATRPRVFVTDDFPRPRRLEAQFELAATPVAVEAIVAFRSTRVDAALFEEAGPSLKVVVEFGVGVDNIDLAEAKRRGVIVVNTPAVSTCDVGQHTLSLMLDLMRNTSRGDRRIRAGDRAVFGQGALVGRSLDRAAVGIVGPGRIGTEVGRLVEACGATATYAGRNQLDALLGNVDVLSLHCPLQPDTFHLIDAGALARLGERAFLVNVARGAIVDEQALVVALTDGVIAGAALDVFEFEPDVSATLRRLDNVVMTPHIGAATVEGREVKAALVAAALEDVLLNDVEPANRVC